MTLRKDTALVIVGHGSTINPDSSEPTHLLADDIRSREIFEEVQCCFWKEEPSLREVLSMISSRIVYVVPNFISEGYFTQTIIPRELELTGDTTERNGKIIRYCNPVGSHPSMTSVLLKRAAMTAPGISPAEISLIIVGHGTTMNDHSSQAAKHQASALQSLNLYAEVFSAYMEEPPLISEWTSMTSQQNVVVIPFFISDGLHSYQDIPVLLGIREEIGPAASQSQIFQTNPHFLQGKKLFYGSAIGTDPNMAEVILDQISAFDTTHHAA